MDNLKSQEIESKIISLRGFQVMLDPDLSKMYNTETKYINRAVKHNKPRFPEDFVFQLSAQEYEDLKFQFGTSNIGSGGRRFLPYVFTEQVIAMLSAVLQTNIDIEVSIRIMKVFVRMRQLLITNATLYSHLARLEIKQLESDQKFERVFKALDRGSVLPERGVFFDGEIFDAYLLISGLIKSAKKQVLLIDNYLDETVLMMLSKRTPRVEAIIYTKNVSPQLKLDLEKHQKQYDPIEIKTLNESHDRFLMIDQQELYLIGASLKDLGKIGLGFQKSMTSFLSFGSNYQKINGSMKQQLIYVWDLIKTITQTAVAQLAEATVIDLGNESDLILEILNLN